MTYSAYYAVKIVNFVLCNKMIIIFVNELILMIDDKWVASVLMPKNFPLIGFSLNVHLYAFWQKVKSLGLALNTI